jgi:hypothetical protein
MLRTFSGAYAALQQLLPGLGADHTADGSCSSTAAAAAAGDNAAAAAISSLEQDYGGGSSSSEPVCWQYLLRLHKLRKLTAAAAALSSKWGAAAIAAVLEPQEDVEQLTNTSSMPADSKAAGNLGQNLTEYLQQLYHDALAFCRVLTAVAPLPVVCNNARCSTIAGMSEAAAARFMCAGCGCRYCSAACQAASWRGHKKACRRMAACGMRVEG